MAFSSGIQLIIDRLKTFYNTNIYNVASNPGGMAGGGHRTNFIPALRDMSDVGVAIAGQADAAAGSAQTASDRSAAAAESLRLAGIQAGNSAASAQAAADLYDLFDDRYLGSKLSDPAMDNDGNALAEGALYWNRSTDPQKKGLRIYSNSQWNTGAFLITSGVNMFAGRVGNVAPLIGDYNTTQITGFAGRTAWASMIS